MGEGSVDTTPPNDHEVHVKTFFITLENILIFTTGANSVPPMGFYPTPSIRFHKKSFFPEANTCANILSLPLNIGSYETFKYYFCFGITNAVGFGQV